MAWFALSNAARMAMILMVIGSWAGFASLAAAVMRPTYNAGTVTLRTATRPVRKARLTRVVATTWMYTIVFIMLATSFVGMGILMQDSDDFFGFQKHILSWEYVLHPKFVVLLCVCGMSASGAAVLKFRDSKVMNAAAFESAWRRGFVVFSAIAVFGFSVMLFLEASRSGGSAGVSSMPSGGNVAKALAVLIASRAALDGFVREGASPKDTKAFLDEYLSDAGVTGEARVKLMNFAYSLPRRLDVTLDSVRSRMQSRGFDAQTSREASDELRAAVVRLRKSAIKKPPTLRQIQAVPALAKLTEKIPNVPSVAKAASTGRERATGMPPARESEAKGVSVRTIDALSAVMQRLGAVLDIMNVAGV